jgi:Pyruvate/2-oxoacid:ferredoxin oxidoreductase delta subunit
MYTNLILYYFTGTGNALAATNWITQVASNKGIHVEIKRITPSLEISTKDLPKNLLIGFCYPTHGFNAPPVVIDFLLRFPRAKNQVFLLNTRAGMKISNLFLPGLSGLAQLLPALILRIKGCSIIGYQPMDLPSNWISIHPGLRQTVVNSIFKRCKRITEKFAEKILADRKIYKGLISLPIDLLISPISIAYFLIGRFALAKTFIADNTCNTCALCRKECPVNAILMKNNRPFWTRKCESCMHCMNVCPQKSIQTPHLFVLIIWWLIFSSIPIFLTSLLSTPESFLSQYFQIFIWLFMIIPGFPILFFSYRILHFLMRFRFFNWLISYTSLTKFAFWRRYFAPKKYLGIKSELK